MKATEMLDKIKETLGLELSKEDTLLAKEKLDNGTILEAQAFQENNEVFIVNGSDKIPLPEGEYTMESGQVLLVKEEGIIASLGEATEEAEPEKEDADLDEEKYATREEFNSLLEMVKAMKEGMNPSEEVDEKETEELTEEVKEKEEVAEIEMSAEVVEPIAHNPEALSAPKSNLPQNTNSQLDRIRDMIYNN